MAKSEPIKDKRRNKVSGLGDVLGGVLDPVMRKRGFASRDLMTNWEVIAPAPYRDVSYPDRLHWKRGAGAEGAVLYLRCAEAQRLAISHDADLISGAINRYFGYLLVQTVKLSAEPFTPRSVAGPDNAIEPDAETKAEIDAQVEQIEDKELKASLIRLGYGLKTARRR